MNSNQISKIIKLNNEFYQQNADEFSCSRSYPWKGWDKITPYLKINNSKIKNILDLGCGNGRFLDFLLHTMPSHTFDYLGIDNSDLLLKIANSRTDSKISNVEFSSVDIFDLDSLPKGKYDMVVSFGVTHHIPGSAFRKKWFNRVSTSVNTDGYLILSFWYPSKAKLLSEKLEGFEAGDYLMGWGTNTANRYVHLYSNLELNKIAEILIKNGFELTLKYKSDAKKDSYNEYYFFKKIK